MDKLETSLRARSLFYYIFGNLEIKKIRQGGTEYGYKTNAYAGA